MDWIADVYIHPGENDLLALAEGALRVLRGEEKVKEYPNGNWKDNILIKTSTHNKRQNIKLYIL